MCVLQQPVARNVQLAAAACGAVLQIFCSSLRRCLVAVAACGASVELSMSLMPRLKVVSDSHIALV